MSGPEVIWFRRDLRVGDQPTFLAAESAGHRALGVFVLDPALLAPAGAARRWFLHGCLRELADALDGRLLLLAGDPVELIPRLAAGIGAGGVHVAADFGPYGADRDAAVEEALQRQGGRLVRTGSPHAVAPGRVRTGEGGRFAVFTPFHRAWLAHGWRAPARTDAAMLDWVDPADAAAEAGLRAADLPERPEDVPADALPEPGEAAALRRWREFLDRAADYGGTRNRPDLPGTSRMSAYLKFGCVHPRTLLADLGDGSGPFGAELAWREFYADVLARRPDSARQNYRRDFDTLPTVSGDAAREAFATWCDGRTGFPIVDAGMRQLRSEGWMHNRVRMITASFLVKDLHLPWQWGARWFMRLLVDGDLAANQHGWQWVAGSGTDAAPYFRVFNPTTQGERFDPNGDYVRGWLPELAGLAGKRAHQPWRYGPAPGYPEPVLDHQRERAEALARFEVVRGQPASR